MAVHNLKQKQVAGAGKQVFKTTGPVSFTVSAKVVSLKDDVFTLELQGTSKTAHKAASCLLMPKVGDKVLCFIDGAQSYILSVLETASTENTHIKISGSLTFETDEDVAFVSNNFNLVTRASTNLYNDKLNMVSNVANFSFSEVMLNSARSITNIEDNKIYSKSIETVADTSTQRFKNSFKFVECMDQLKAGNLMQTVRNLFSSRSRQAIMQADQDVKIDGERIHMG